MSADPTNIYIGGSNHLDENGVTITVPNAESSMPASNLTDFQVEKPWRSTTNTADYQIRFQLSDADVKASQGFALLNTNFSQAGTYNLFAGGEIRNASGYGWPDFNGGGSGLSNFTDTGTGSSVTLDGSNHLNFSNLGFGSLAPDNLSASPNPAESNGTYPNSLGVMVETKLSGITGGQLTLQIEGTNIDYTTNGTHFNILTSGFSSSDLINSWTIFWGVVGGNFTGTLEYIKLRPIVYSNLAANLIGPAVPYGGLPWGCFNFYGVVPDDLYSGMRKNMFDIFDGCYGIGEVVIQISDTTNSDGYLQIGRAYIAGGFIPWADKAVGWSIEWKDDSTNSKSEGGQTFIDDKNKRRVLKFELPEVGRAEHAGMIQAILRQVGTSKDIIVVPRPDDKAYHLTEAIHGRLTKLGPARKKDGCGDSERWKVVFEVEELV